MMQLRMKKALNQDVFQRSYFFHSVLTRMIMQDRLNVSGKDKSLDGAIA